MEELLAHELLDQVRKKRERTRYKWLVPTEASPVDESGNYVPKHIENRVAVMLAAHPYCNQSDTSGWQVSWVTASEKVFSDQPSADTHAS